MSLISKKFKLIWLTILLTTFCGTIFPKVPLLGYENNKSSLTTNEINDSLESSNTTPYIVDSGDVLNFYFHDLEVFSGNYTVDLNGNIYLPDIEKFYVRGKSVEELEDEINFKYSEFLKDPDIAINLFAARPVNILIKGEVKRPGLYTLNYQNQAVDVSRNLMGKTSMPIAPKVFDALQLSRGLRLNADLSNIVVIRDN